jgi:hypothetical protein
MAVAAVGANTNFGAWLYRFDMAIAPDDVLRSRYAHAQVGRVWPVRHPRVALALNVFASLQNFGNCLDSKQSSLAGTHTPGFRCRGAHFEPT